ncbi:MAG: helix-turn-helix domain-containing protein [Clostridium sp.]|jgi:YesN/AraC family two-component response regulator|uniref:AraC family transcriptional regulator n=1 Tax=Clostridium sp. TaxID=1506 RepID=UPI0025C2A8D1|nr:helix-turn-helix domain-containing protein [Clostridium sp.]MCH3965839.1 helix-turn-helix domain-containing protein [Clostridium sp.]MCI1716072.1 helix-turn-helix domain-containing protein [Clostridium sp.]MCI1800256.1 helix-turn-helix domain-containing protein [Clostridium sp.]MCI1814249.1 helix-turn-helix domain-containing protein [Clostridium sp.]MCI1871148.1 helix-turn-helix domain-containing protein [Clostridium sp.]
MNIRDLDKKLREMSPSEEKLKKLSGFKKDKSYDMELERHFSNRIIKNSWVINNEKLMKNSEDISIRKHDRFVKFNKHKHDYLELVFVYSGSIRQTVDDKSIEIKKGEILIMDMNVEHSIEESGEDDIAINVLIKKEFFDWVFMHQIADNDLMSNFIVKSLYEKNKFKQFLYFKTSKNKKVWNFMISILMEYHDNKNGMETAIRAYMILLFNELLRDYNKYLPHNVVYKIDSSIAVEIMKYIGNDYKNANLKDLAEHFNYSTDYMGKLVKKVTGKTFKELQKNIKIERAKYLLKNSNTSISDIVSKVGYSNLSYFYKQFKEDTGITPDEYRKNL